jgi:TPR repeat protein
MAATGIGGDEDSKLSRAHFDRVSPYPELLHRCLVANAEAGSRTAWFELWRLHERSFDESISPTDRIGYLEMAAEAGDAKARTALASLLMYSWLGSKFGMQRDHQRAERLLLANEQDGVRVDHQLYCLYSMSGPLKDGTKAIHWKSRDAERGHPTAFATLARLHADASGGETDRMLVARYLYLHLCQSQSPIKSDQLRLLEQCTEEEIREGRAQARAWIRDHGSAAPAFGGELRDPFER